MGEEQGFTARLADMLSATGVGFVWFLLLAAWGGTASYISRIKKMQTRFSIMELVGEWTISAFAGVVTAFICYEMQFSFYATAALAGIAGHMGGRAIALLENFIEATWNQRFGCKRPGGNREDSDQ